MDRNGRDARLAMVAGRQAGLFTFRQAIEQGFPRATISRRLVSGAWERAHVGVLALAGSPRTWEAKLWGGVLAVGGDSVITHESSALIHGAERLAFDPVIVTNPHRWHHAIPGVFAHQIDDLTPAWRTRWRGLPVSTAARCVVELGATQPYPVVARVADDLIANRSATIGGITAAFAAVARPGKPGMLTVARVLDERSEGWEPPRSELERALFAVLKAGGLPDPDRQVRLPGRGLTRGIADAAYRDARIIIEADGRRWHNRLQVASADRVRDAEVVRAGWVPLRFMFEQIVGDPAGVCAVVSDTRAARLALLGRAA